MLCIVAGNPSRCLIMENPELCKSCQKCQCVRPSLTTDEYIVMCEKVGVDAVHHCIPTYMDGAWMFVKGCPANTGAGCALTHEFRPLMCRLYPWVAVPLVGPLPEDTKVRLFLAADQCPHWKYFGDNYPQAKEEFDNG